MLVAGVAVVAGALTAASSGLVGRPAPAPEPAARCEAVPGPLAADVDGDGCEEGVAFADGIVTAGLRRLAVGAPGDRVTTGRWTCGGRLLALLRPATGQIFRFDAWASDSQPVATTAGAQVDGAVGLQAVPGAIGGCDDLAVSRSQGPPVVVWRGRVAG
jgi:hypothetical protein